MKAASHDAHPKNTAPRPAAKNGRLSRRECRTLLRCLAGEPPEQNCRHWQALVDTAQRHKVAAFIAQHLDCDQLPEAASSRLQEHVGRARQRTERAHRGLAEILAEAGRRKLSLLVFKGPALCKMLYPQPELRSFFDIDLLVRPAELEQAEQLLVDLNYEMTRLQPSDMYWMTGVRAEIGDNAHYDFQKSRELWLAHHFHFPFVPLDAERSVKVDLHWALFPDVLVKLPLPDFWQRAVPIEVCGHRTLTFAPVDNLLYLCLHLSTDGYPRVRLMKLMDIVQAGDQLAEADWRRLLEMGEELGVEKMLFLALCLSYRTFGRTLPKVVEEAKPTSLQMLLLNKALSERALFSNNSPAADAAWDWILGSSGGKLMVRMLRATARQSLEKTFLGRFILTD